MTSVPEKHPLSILLVDDSTETTHQLAILLQHMRPWRIVSANSLDEAKRHLGSQQRFDVVVTDMVLSPFGDENGIGVIDAVRRSGLSGVPVVAYTAFPGQFAKELDELGVPVVSKIAALDALVRVIEEVATARPVRSAR